MSKKDSSSKPGKNKDDEVADTASPVVVDDESAGREASESAAESEVSETAAKTVGGPDDGKSDAGASDTDADSEAPVDTESDSPKAGEAESPADTESATPAADEKADDSGADRAALPPPKAQKPRRSWFGLFNFLLILAIVAAAAYYWRLEQQTLKEYDATIADLRALIDSRVTAARLDSGLSSLKGEIGGLQRKLGELETGQQGLRESSEKLYELFGRDRADWQLAEVEYLMRVAQHKLILENDFAGAAITLQAASDRIGLTGDPGLLPVRVTISEEIAELKTRERPDLVGMTLTLARLARQARMLQPGFAPRIDESGEIQTPVQVPSDWQDRVLEFIDSLVEVRHEAAAPTEIEANIVNVGETLEDNLKLARWAVLDRDARQYAELIDASLQLLREYYDLDNAVNHDFMSELQALRKMQLSPDKPDITGSLRQMQRILSQRENAPEAASEEPVDG